MKNIHFKIVLKNQRIVSSLDPNRVRYNRRFNNYWKMRKIDWEKKRDFSSFRYKKASDERWKIRNMFENERERERENENSLSPSLLKFPRFEMTCTARKLAIKFLQNIFFYVKNWNLTGAAFFKLKIFRLEWKWGSRIQDMRAFKEKNYHNNNCTVFSCAIKHKSSIFPLSLSLSPLTLLSTAFHCLKHKALISRKRKIVEHEKKSFKRA